MVGGWGELGADSFPQTNGVEEEIYFVVFCFEFYEGFLCGNR